MKIGIIGGSGLYDMEGLKNRRKVVVKTPFGAPSDVYLCGTLEGRDLCFLPRHGRGHRLLPSEINHRANIFGLKKLGVERVVSVSAVGSLREGLRPRDIVLPDQYFDRTKGSLAHTFFGRGIVAHVSFGDPVCPELNRLVAATADTVAAAGPRPCPRVVRGGTYVNMEGPAFSTRTESDVYRRMGFDVIGMTSLPEAKLCREAELCYQAIAMVTDYDCWRRGEEAVTVDAIVATLRANVRLGQEIVCALVARLPAQRGCGCGDALRYAILSDLKAVPAKTAAAMAPLMGRYLPGRKPGRRR